MGLFRRKKNVDREKTIVKPFSTTTATVARDIAAVMISSLVDLDDDAGAPQVAAVMIEAGREHLIHLGITGPAPRALVDLVGQKMRGNITVPLASESVTERACVSCEQMLLAGLTSLYGANIHVSGWVDGQTVMFIAKLDDVTTRTLNGKICQLCEVSPMAYLPQREHSSTAQCLSKDCGLVTTYKK